MLKIVVEILYLQELEYEMDRADLPGDYNFLKSDIVVILSYFTHIFNLSKPPEVIHWATLKPRL